MPHTPTDLADRIAARRQQARTDDGYVCEIVSPSREQARHERRLTHVSAAVILTARKQGTSHRIRLAHAAIPAMRKPPVLLSPAVNLRSRDAITRP